MSVDTKGSTEGSSARARCDDAWQVVLGQPPIGDGKVQVWRMDLRAGGADALLTACYAVLSDQERRRAARLREGRPREEFVAARGSLRRLLGGLLSTGPADVMIQTGKHGKPQVPGSGIDFNASHSGGIVLIALSRAGAVGVDVEAVDHRVDVLEVGRTAFGPQELQEIERAAPGDGQTREFIRCWTRREAVLKADGRGLVLPPGEIAWNVNFEVAQISGGGRVAVHELPSDRPYFAALAIIGEASRVNLFDLLPNSAHSSSWFFGA